MARLSHVDQNYVRVETIRAANARLIAAQRAIPLANAWGGGLVASFDGLRFVALVAAINAGPNPPLLRNAPGCDLVKRRQRPVLRHRRHRGSGYGP